MPSNLAELLRRSDKDTAQVGVTSPLQPVPCTLEHCSRFMQSYFAALHKGYFAALQSLGHLHMGAQSCLVQPLVNMQRYMCGPQTAKKSLHAWSLGRAVYDVWHLDSSVRGWLCGNLRCGFWAALDSQRYFQWSTFWLPNQVGLLQAITITTALARPPTREGPFAGHLAGDKG